MNEKCLLIIFSDKAYNAIIRESLSKDPVETGGILLGHISEDGAWFVVDVIPPGPKSIFQYAYCEFDNEFVNYLAPSVANQYKIALRVLGLWHRHPGSMDVFSTTDDGTNTTFANKNSSGVISGLVNIDPTFRLTMYHLDHGGLCHMGRPRYEKIEYEVGDEFIPEEYFELRYYNGVESNLHPSVDQHVNNSRTIQEVPELEENLPNRPSSVDEREDDKIDIQRIISGQLPPCANDGNSTPKAVTNFFPFWRDSKKKWWYALLAVVALILTVSTFRSCKSGIEKLFDGDKTEKVDEGLDSKNPSLSVESINLKVGDVPARIEVYNLPQDAKVKWQSSDNKIASVKNGNITPVSAGKAEVTAYVGKDCIGKCIVTVETFHDAEEEIAEASDKALESADETVSVSLKSGSGSVKSGKSFILSLIKTGNPDVSYSSSDTIVATVSKQGVVTGRSKGTAEIIVDWVGGEPLHYKLTVQ